MKKLVLLFLTICLLIPAGLSPLRTLRPPGGPAVSQPPLGERGNHVPLHNPAKCR